MPSSFSVSGTDQLRRALAEAGDLATMALASAMVEEMLAVVATAKELVPANIGTLKGTGTVLPPDITGTRIEVVGGFGNSASKYAIWVHEGRLQGSKAPPVGAIKQWLHDKGYDEDLAWVTARNIGRRGIKATKFLERPFLERESGMPGRMADGVAKALERLRSA